MFLPDTPLSDPDQDLFDRWPFAQRLARAIAARSDPSSLVVAVYGAWGDGKSTVLNFVEAELARHDHILCVRFNPWRFGDEAQLLLSFFALLADALGKSLTTTTEKIGDFLQKYAAIVAPLSLSFAGVGVSPGQTAVEFGKHLSGVELRELRRRIEKILSEAQKRVVILMDDIDRLDKSEIHAVFKLVKLTADFDHTAYVLAFDDVMVAGALQEKYSAGKAESGFSFLEKIVQVPLNLPHADRIALQQLCFQSVNQALNDSQTTLDEQQVQVFGRHFVDGLEIRLGTPRMCKRYGNALSFALPLLKGEVNPVDLMLIEGIRVFYPQVYAVLRDNGEFFHGTGSTDKVKERTQALLATATDALTTREQECVTSLLKALFPKLSGLLGGPSYESDWYKTWAKEQRVCSPDYFARYFTYAVPTGDVSDATILGFLANLRDRTVAEVVARLADILDKSNAEKFVQKLREREKTIGEADSALLSKAIVRVGASFPNPEQMFSFRNAWSQAAILVNQLLLNVADRERRLTLAAELLRDAMPLSFSVECLRWMTSGDKEPEEERTFVKSGETELGRIVASRIKQEAEGKNVYAEYGNDARFLVWSWAHWGNKEDVEKYLLGLFDSDSTNVIRFLDSYRPTEWGLKTGVSHKGDLMRGQFDSIVALLDPTIVMERLLALFGDGLKDATPERWEYTDYPPDKKVAFQFAGMFNHVRNEKETSQQTPPAYPEGRADAPSGSAEM